MNPLNLEIFDLIREDVEDGYLLEDTEATTYHKDLNAFSLTYVVEWFPDPDLKDGKEDDDDEEENYHSFFIELYIFKDKTFKVHCDPGLYDLMYRGYDTEEEQKAYNDFKEMARAKGLLLE